MVSRGENSSSHVAEVQAPGGYGHGPSPRRASGSIVAGYELAQRPWIAQCISGDAISLRFRDDV